MRTVDSLGSLSRVVCTQKDQDLHQQSSTVTSALVPSSLVPNRPSRVPSLGTMNESTMQMLPCTLPARLLYHRSSSVVTLNPAHESSGSSALADSTMGPNPSFPAIALCKNVQHHQPLLSAYDRVRLTLRQPW
jgi:hypothetical protein